MHIAGHFTPVATKKQRQSCSKASTRTQHPTNHRKYTKSRQTPSQILSQPGSGLRPDYASKIGPYNHHSHLFIVRSSTSSPEARSSLLYSAPARCYTCLQPFQIFSSMVACRKSVEKPKENYELKYFYRQQAGCKSASSN